MKRLVFLAALVLAPLAHAGVTLSNFPPNPGVLPGGGWQFTPGTTFADPTPPRAWVNGVYQGVPSATLTETMALNGPAGRLAVAVSSTAKAVDIAASLARVAARASLPLAAGMLAVEMLGSVGIRQGSSGAEIDPGQPEQDTQVVEWAYVGLGPGGPIKWNTKASAACAAAIGDISNNGTGFAGRFVSVSDSESGTKNWICKGEMHYPSDCSNGSCTWREITINRFDVRVENKKACPEIIDALTGQSYIPGKFEDGTCITGRYEPATDAKLQARLSPLAEARTVDALKAAIQAGATVDSSPYTITGPASQTGTPVTTTTTGPNGTTTTTTTPTYNYTYGPNNITVNTVNTTVNNTTNNAGDTTTTTTTETKDGTDDKGMCAMYPDSLACVKPGTPPTDAAPVPRDVPFSIDPVSFGGQGSCPPPITFSALGGSYAFEWTPMCNVLVTWVRPVVLVLSVAAAAMIFIGGLKS